jgi:hypothetical protein
MTPRIEKFDFPLGILLRPAVDRAHPGLLLGDIMYTGPLGHLHAPQGPYGTAVQPGYLTHTRPSSSIKRVCAWCVLCALTAHKSAHGHDHSHCHAHRDPDPGFSSPSPPPTSQGPCTIVMCLLHAYRTLTKLLFLLCAMYSAVTLMAMKMQPK